MQNKDYADLIRYYTLKELGNIGYGHYGGALSIVETLAVLYNSKMRYDVSNPKSEDRDYFILSKGHAGPSYYAALAIAGFFKKEKLYTLNENGTNLPSHPDRLKVEGVDMTTGSLGQGLSVAAGIAYHLKNNNKKNRVYCILGVDGVEVEHSDVSSAVEGAADVFFMAKDIAEGVHMNAKVVVLESIIDMEEIREKVKKTCEELGLI